MLRALKGTDASNMNDEEIADEEQEYSDDDQEMAHKRSMKQKRQAKREGADDGEMRTAPQRQRLPRPKLPTSSNQSNPNNSRNSMMHQSNEVNRRGQQNATHRYQNQNTTHQHQHHNTTHQHQNNRGSEGIHLYGQRAGNDAASSMNPYGGYMHQMPFPMPVMPQFMSMMVPPPTDPISPTAPTPTQPFANILFPFSQGQQNVNQTTALLNQLAVLQNMMQQQQQPDQHQRSGNEQTQSLQPSEHYRHY